MAWPLRQGWYISLRRSQVPQRHGGRLPPRLSSLQGTHLGWAVERRKYARKANAFSAVIAGFGRAPRASRTTGPAGSLGGQTPTRGRSPRFPATGSCRCVRTPCSYGHLHPRFNLRSTAGSCAASPAWVVLLGAALWCALLRAKELVKRLCEPIGYAQLCCSGKHHRRACGLGMILLGRDFVRFPGIALVDEPAETHFLPRHVRASSPCLRPPLATRKELGSLPLFLACEWGRPP